MLELNSKIKFYKARWKLIEENRFTIQMGVRSIICGKLYLFDRSYLKNYRRFDIFAKEKLNCQLHKNSAM